MQESRKRAGENGLLDNPHPPKTRKVETMLKQLFAVNRSFKEHINTADPEGCFEMACLQYTEYVRRLRRDHPDTWAFSEQAVDNAEQQGAIAGRRTPDAPSLRMVAHKDEVGLDVKRGEDAEQQDAFTPSNPRPFASTDGQEVRASFSFPAQHQEGKAHTHKSTPFPGLDSKVFKGAGKLPKVVESPANPGFGKSNAGGARGVGNSNAGGLFGTQPMFGFGASQNQSAGFGGALAGAQDANEAEQGADASGDPGSYDGGEEYDAEEAEEEIPVSEGGEGEYEEATEQEDYETEENGANTSDQEEPQALDLGPLPHPSLGAQQEGGEEDAGVGAGIFDKQGQEAKSQGIVTGTREGGKPLSSESKPMAGFGGAHGGFGSPGVKPFSFKTQDSIPTPIAFGSPHSVKSTVTDSVGSTPNPFGGTNLAKSPASNPASQSMFGNAHPPIFGQSSPIPTVAGVGDKKKTGESILKLESSIGGFGDKPRMDNKKVTFGNGIAIFAVDKPTGAGAGGADDNGHAKLSGGVLGGTDAPSSPAMTFSSQPVFGSSQSGAQQPPKTSPPIIFGATAGGGETKTTSSGFGGFGTGFGSLAKPLFGSPGQSTESTGKVTFGQPTGAVFGHSSGAGGFTVPVGNVFSVPKPLPASSQPPLLFGAGAGAGAFGAPTSNPILGNENKASSGLGTFTAPTGPLFGGSGGAVQSFSTTTGQEEDEALPKEAPAVEVKDNDTWEVKSKAKSKLHRLSEGSWKQVGIGCVSVRVKKAGERAGKAYLMFSTDSGTVLMCTPLYSGMQVIEKSPKMLVTVGTFLEKTIIAEDPSAPQTQEKWVSGQALIQVGKPETAQELKKAIELLKDK